MNKILREYIKEIILEKKKVAEKRPGSGIVIVKKIDNEWKVLGLQVYGKYDIPKGVIEDAEDPLSAAMRETQEEANITQVNFDWGLESFSVSHLTVFLASTTQDAEIIKNPHTGIYEHHSADWLDWEDMKSKAYGYLVPAIQWAQDKVAEAN